MTETFISRKRGAVLLLALILAVSLGTPVFAANTSEEAVIRDVAMEITERIIATGEALNAGQEVRLPIRESLLPDVEILICKDGGEILVTFVTPNLDTMHLLSRHTGELHSLIWERLRDVDYVEVRLDYTGGETATVFGSGSAWMIIGGCLVLAAGVAVLLIRRRRSSASDRP